MKVVIIPGVGYQTKKNPLQCLGDRIKSAMSCEYEIFSWDHTPIKSALEVATLAVELRKDDGTSYEAMRSFVTEVILDFEFALKYGAVINVPEGDYYIGHSAGSLFAMAQNKPSTIIGSPVALVKYMPKSAHCDNLFVNSILDNCKSVLNLINKYDVVAYPLNEPNVENIYFSGNKLNPLSYFPLTAHTGYWESKFVSDQIIKHMKSVIK